MILPGRAACPQLGEPVAVTATGADWARVRADLRHHGSALVHGRLADWRPDEGDERALRAVLGRDWARYRDIAHDEIRKRYAASRSLLKHAAAAALRADVSDVELAYGPTGRPSLRGCDQIDISLSHTDDLLLVGLTSRGLIGVDAELASRQLYRKGLAQHICTPQERRDLERLPDEERNPSLLRLWTLKEAYSKAIGQGMQFRFSEFGFGPDGKPVRVNRPDGTPGVGAEWFFRTYSLDVGGVLFVVSAAVHDAGLGRTLDTEITTMLDAETVDVINASLRDKA
ncbi:4'-phosphopantetheinyl transferase family protein [Streptomyces beihaiensis]|uniref:4'-phosphopantetheinyl transferase superfamily protein n=1 Tax=Streptomyces beihaiensis TaxID=2984495 RepID=A0ABT3TX46_9ACTN|nr:4'-phosphopantetheinyl transferase superfamily protein [Streptomyces beihaiensis]MCX3061380.1 4'-phosphopantetheinyl transferase superfamily protein [Streptomyces beihaiensis]